MTLIQDSFNVNRNGKRISIVAALAGISIVAALAGKRRGMIFRFDDAELMSLCNSATKLRRAFGSMHTPIIQRTLFSLDIAPTLADLSSLPPISRKRIGDDAPPVYAAGDQGIGQIFFRSDMSFITDNLAEISEIRIINIGGAV